MAPGLFYAVLQVLSWIFKSTPTQPSSGAQELRMIVASIMSVLWALLGQFFRYLPSMFSYPRCLQWRSQAVPQEGPFCAECRTHWLAESSPQRCEPSSPRAKFDCQTCLPWPCTEPEGEQGHKQIRVTIIERKTERLSCQEMHRGLIGHCDAAGGSLGLRQRDFA